MFSRPTGAVVFGSTKRPVAFPRKLGRTAENYHSGGCNYPKMMVSSGELQSACSIFMGWPANICCISPNIPCTLYMHSPPKVLELQPRKAHRTWHCAHRKNDKSIEMDRQTDMQAGRRTDIQKDGTGLGSRIGLEFCLHGHFWLQLKVWPLATCLVRVGTEWIRCSGAHIIWH